ncbi:hypothetical protein [Streptomyces sp. NPDC093109]|uniref:hypothetical protein n=1 Tax=Streptomyces sp. NPDC093109 TaxID=3154977 RepID=UPI00344C35C3
MDDDEDRTVLTFRPRGAVPPGLPPLPDDDEDPPTPPAAPPPSPADEPGSGGADLVAARTRRSAADSLAALTAGPPSLPPLPSDGPATTTVALRSEGLGDGEGGRDPEAPGLGALGLSAVLAVALAALRGTATAVQDWRQRRLEHEAETAPLREARLKHRLAAEEAHAKHALAMAGLNDQAAQKKGVPSSSEFGRRSAGSGSGGGAGGGGSRGSFGGGRGPSAGGSGKGAGGTGSGGGKGAGGTGGGSGRSNSGSVGTGGGFKGQSGTSGSGAGGSKGSSGGSQEQRSKDKGPKAPGKASGGIRSPLNGKSSHASASTPTLERARGRNERAAARQDAKIQRRGADHAAALDGRNRDRDQARDRKQAVKEARRVAKENRAAEKRERKEETAAAEPERTTLAQATTEEARRRLEKRRGKLAPPVLSKTGKKDDKTKGGAGDSTAPAAPKVDLTKKPAPAPAAGSGPGPKVNLTKKPKPSTVSAGPKVRLTKKPKPGAAGGAGPKVDLTKKPRKPSAGGKGPAGPGRKKARVGSKGKKSAGTGPAMGPSARRKERCKERARRADERARAGAAAGDWFTGPDPDGSWLPPREERRSAYESMWDTDPQQEWTAESLHVPVSQARRWDPAAVTTGARGLPASPSSTITKEARVSAASVSVPSMRDSASAEHMTEVTLDDVLDKLADAKDECLTTYDECAVLAHRAVQLGDALRDLAAELAERHNIIGCLTSRAMYRLAESMDLLRVKAEAMRAQSLVAAESVELAHDEMHDAYRPVQQAAVDAGLHMPSARIHNED